MIVAGWLAAELLLGSEFGRESGYMVGMECCFCVELAAFMQWDWGGFCSELGTGNWGCDRELAAVFGCWDWSAGERFWGLVGLDIGKNEKTVLYASLNKKTGPTTVMAVDPIFSCLSAVGARPPGGQEDCLLCLPSSTKKQPGDPHGTSRLFL